MTKVIRIDTNKGGNGDIWMRLISLYTISALVPEYKLIIRIPKVFENIANSIFSDRLQISTTEFSESNVLYYTSLGIKDLIKPLFLGKRFISPYQRSIINDKKKKEFKDQINLIIFSFTDLLGLVVVPDKKWITAYQGYLDIIAIKNFKSVKYEDFISQLKLDSNSINNKLLQNTPISKGLSVPKDLNQSLLIFPTGTSRQFVPVWWAVKFFPNAYYAFFYKDKETESFINRGLKVIYFYEEPGDIIYLSKLSKWTISTDSFPSHLLQYSNAKTTIVLTEVLKSRIISPSFKGIVVDSVASCHPCLHMARGIHKLCAAGFEECINWKNQLYTEKIFNSTHKN